MSSGCSWNLAIQSASGLTLSPSPPISLPRVSSSLSCLLGSLTVSTLPPSRASQIPSSSRITGPLGSLPGYEVPHPKEVPEVNESCSVLHASPLDHTPSEPNPGSRPLASARKCTSHIRTCTSPDHAATYPAIGFAAHIRPEILKISKKLSNRGR